MEVDDDVGFEDQDLGDQFIQNFHDANTQNAVKMMMSATIPDFEQIGEMWFL